MTAAASVKVRCRPGSVAGPRLLVHAGGLGSRPDHLLARWSRRPPRAGCSRTPIAVRRGLDRRRRRSTHAPTGAALPNVSGIDRSWPAPRTVAIDLAIAATVCAAALVYELVDAGDDGARLDAVDVGTCAGAAALILLRRRAPLTVLVVAVVAAVWSLIPDEDPGVLRVAAFLALYTAASTSSRRTAWTAGAATAAVLYVTAAITSPGPWYYFTPTHRIAVALRDPEGDGIQEGLRRRDLILSYYDRLTALAGATSEAGQGDAGEIAPLGAGVRTFIPGDVLDRVDALRRNQLTELAFLEALIERQQRRQGDISATERAEIGTVDIEDRRRRRELLARLAAESLRATASSTTVSADGTETVVDARWSPSFMGLDTPERA